MSWSMPNNLFLHKQLSVPSFLPYAVFSIFFFLSTPVNYKSRIISYPDRFSSSLFSSWSSLFISFLAYAFITFSITAIFFLTVKFFSCSLWIIFLLSIFMSFLFWCLIQSDQLVQANVHKHTGLYLQNL